MVIVLYMPIASNNLPKQIKATVLLGAGASVPFGYPATVGFLEELKDRDLPELNRPLSTILNWTEASTLDEFIRELSDVVPRHSNGRISNNFVKDISSRSNSTLNVATAWTEFQKDCKIILDEVYKFIYRTYSWHGRLDEGQKHLKYYLNIVNNMNDGHIPVFTTNYDVSVESLSGNGYEINNLFKNDNPVDPKRWVGQEAFSHGRKVINYFKLHGSVDWSWINGTLICSGTQHPYLRSLSKDDGEIISPGMAVGIERASEPYMTYFDYLEEYLHRTDVCIIIGHKLDDEEIWRVINRHQPPLIMINPDKSIEEKLDGYGNNWNIYGKMESSGSKSSFKKCVNEEFV